MKPGPLPAAAALAAAVLISHFPLLGARYVQDDHVAIVESRVVAEGDLSNILGASYWEGARGGDRTLYRPLTVATYAAERAMTTGTLPRPRLSHAVNLALHAATAWLVYAVAAAAGIEPLAALIAALLFAVTPSKSEAVANVVGRAEILAALFTLAAVRWSLATGKRTAAWAAAACVLLACASKETGVMALPLVALAAFVFSCRRYLDAANMVAPSLLAFTVFAVARTRALEAFFPPQTVPPIDNPLVLEHGTRYLATALGLAARYARIVVLPFRLANDYSCRSIPIETSFAAFWPLAGIVVLCTLAWLFTRGRTAALCAALIALPYLLVSNLFVPVGSIFAERFLYLPEAGVSLLAALVIAKLGKPARVAFLAVIVLLAPVMYLRSLDWRSDVTIFTATSRNNPLSPRAWLWIGKPDQAIVCCPEFAAGWSDQGVALARKGDLAGAESALRQAARIEPTRTAPHTNLGIVLHRRGDLAGAEREVRKSTLLDPDNARAFAELGLIRSERGNRSGAADAYRRAIALGRTDLAPRLKELE